MKFDISPMLNAYPDSMGGTLHDIVQLLARPEFENVFGSFYILPSVFNTDLDRGFSVIDYTLNRELAAPQDIEGLKVKTQTGFYPEPRFSTFAAVPGFAQKRQKLCLPGLFY